MPENNSFSSEQMYEVLKNQAADLVNRKQAEHSSQDESKQIETGKETNKFYSSTLEEFKVLEQNFRDKGDRVEYGNILAIAAITHKRLNPDYYSNTAVMVRKYEKQPYLDWKTISEVVTDIAKKEGINIPKYAEKGEQPQIQGYSSQEELLNDLQERTVPLDPEEMYVDVYRGVNTADRLQLAGGLRDLKFSLQELEELPASIIAEIGSEGNARVERLRILEAKHPIPTVKAYYLQQSAMEYSAWVSTTTDPNIAAKFGDQIIHARVPVSQILDLENLTNKVYSNGEGPITHAENEIGVRGWINPEWIVSTTSSENLPKHTHVA